MAASVIAGVQQQYLSDERQTEAILCQGQQRIQDRTGFRFV